MKKNILILLLVAAVGVRFGMDDVTFRKEGTVPRR
jgi:hypothetical protein